jgi:hypothetical protein
LQYGAVMIVDPEEEFYPEEVAKLAEDVRRRGLGLLVFGEWYNVDVQAKMRFFDDNTRSWWTPITGGDGGWTQPAAVCESCCRKTMQRADPLDGCLLSMRPDTAMPTGRRLHAVLHSCSHCIRTFDCAHVGLGGSCSSSRPLLSWRSPKPKHWSCESTSPSAGGANIPALNELLEPFGVAFGDMVLEGQLPELAGDSPWYASGANIVRWPAAGWLHAAVLADKASEGGPSAAVQIPPWLHLVMPCTPRTATLPWRRLAGRLAQTGSNAWLTAAAPAIHCKGHGRAPEVVICGPFMLCVGRSTLLGCTWSMQPRR